MRAIRRAVAALTLVLGIASAAFAQIPAQPPAQRPAQAPDLAGLMRQITEHTKAGRLDAAVPLARRLVAESERIAGKEHLLTATTLTALGELYGMQGKHDEAEAALERVLAIREKALGPAHADVAATLASLANIAIQRGRYADAERTLQRAQAIRERTLGPEHYDTAMTWVALGRIRHAQARYADAEALFTRALDVLRKARGPERMLAGTVLNNLAVVYQEQGRLAPAEAHLREALAMQEAQLGAESPAVPPILNNLAEVYARQGRYAEAEQLHRRALQIAEKALGASNPEVATHLGNLATLLTYRGRAGEAEGLQKRALAITEKAYGPRHPAVGSILNNLAYAIDSQGRTQEAETLYRRSLALRESLFGPEHDAVATSLVNVAGVLTQARRLADAEPIVRRALAIRQKLLGAGHPRVADSLNDLGVILDNLKRHGEAGPLLDRALAIREAALGPSHPDVAVSLNNVAFHHLDLGDWQTAYARFKASYALWTARRSLASGTPEPGASKEIKTEAISPFLGLIIAAYRLANPPGSDPSRNPSDPKAAVAGEGSDPASPNRLRAEAFEAAQWAGGESASTAIARMAARAAAGSGQLADLARERQDLVEQAAATDRAIIALMSQPPEQRAPGADTALRQRADAIAARLKQADAALAGRFPQYAALTSAATVSLQETAALVAADEALLVLAPTRDNTYLWAVTRDAVRWIEVPLGTKALEMHVAALRCGLDRIGTSGGEAARRCAELLGPDAGAGGRPFDLQRAHELYRALLGPVEDLIEGKHLLLVPAGPLASLPFHVLVTELPQAGGSATNPTGADYAAAGWLAKRHAVSVLPSVASLEALRRYARGSEARAPFIGFGNPLLTGPAGTDRRAWARTACGSGDSAALPPAPAAAARAPATPLPKLMQGGLAQPELVRRQPPLPETADEVCAVARLLGANQDTVHLGPGATERAVKALSDSGALRGARYVHFATHGLLASEAEIVEARAEPALLLTPPQQASEEDDGLLTASEVAQLKLDADWVILSACNTAAGDNLNAEALSGLARAFFYAGSRALLASHWSVDSDAAVALVTTAFAEINAHPGLPRAEALRRAMLALIAKGGRNAHPAVWAPFVVVGEGGR